jgi:ribosomal protein L7/L12
MVVHLTGVTDNYHAIRAVKAIRAATGLGLHDALLIIEKLERSESIRLVTKEPLTRNELAFLFSSSGVEFEFSETR